MSAEPSLPVTIASRYVPVRLIARGGMGAVYEVEHVRTGEHFALKVMLLGVGASHDALQRFKREARAPGLIKSEHIVRIIDADVAAELGGAPFLVMELLDGTDLEQVALPTDPSIVVDWLRQVALAVDGAHRLGIVHRDLKPENLFLAKRPHGPPLVKVLDFGIAKMSDEGTFTASGTILGTPRYMAPEQASAGSRVTPATDRFALGLVAYRLLTGESFYGGDSSNVMAILTQLLEPLRRPSERRPELSAAFDAWFARACHRLPEHRFASAAQQIEALAAALELPANVVDPRQALDTTVSAHPRLPAKGRLSSPRVIPVVGAVLAVAVVVWLSARGPSRAPVPRAIALTPPNAPAAGPKLRPEQTTPAATLSSAEPPPVSSGARAGPPQAEAGRAPALHALPPPKKSQQADPFADQK